MMLFCGIAAENSINRTNERAMRIIYNNKEDRDAYTGGTGGAAVPSALFCGGQEGEELPYIQISLYLSYFVKGHIPEF